MMTTHNAAMLVRYIHMEILLFNSDRLTLTHVYLIIITFLVNKIILWKRFVAFILSREDGYVFRMVMDFEGRRCEDLEG